MLTDRFLLIKSLGGSFWADVDHAMCQLLAAELTGRIPVVYWGMESMYSGAMTVNSFETYFEPVSGYKAGDVARTDYSYYPPVWNYTNVLAEDTDRLKMEFRDLKRMMESGANVVVSDVFYPIRAMMPWIRQGHWAYGKTPYQIYRVLYNKYLVLKSDVKYEMQRFINMNPDFRDEKPILCVHVRGDAIVNEVAQIYDLNELYKPNIWQFIVRYNMRHIFLITDSKKEFKEYKKLYGRNDILIPSNSRKKPLKPRVATCLLDHPNKRTKGVEMKSDTIDVIKDVYLAAQCDFFLGNGYSSLSNAVLRLKDWPETNARLLY